MAVNEEKERELKIDEKLKVREGNISLVLDSYDALFTDFDPRPYSERALSDDFLLECKRAVREKGEIIELRLLIPTQLRKHSEEPRIRKRLRDHFKKHFKEQEKEIRGIRRRGILWFFIGSIILTISTFLFEYKGSWYQYAKFLFDFLFIISQPAGWFTLWEGLEMIFIISQEKMPDYNFYKKMANANIYFLNY